MYIFKQISTGNRFCSHPSKIESKQKYNSDGKQIGLPWDKPNKNFLSCSRPDSQCGAEFFIIQRRNE